MILRGHGIVWCILYFLYFTSRLCKWWKLWKIRYLLKKIRKISRNDKLSLKFLKYKCTTHHFSEFHTPASCSLELLGNKTCSVRSAWIVLNSYGEILEFWSAEPAGTLSIWLIFSENWGYFLNIFLCFDDDLLMKNIAVETDNEK